VDHRSRRLRELESHADDAGFQAEFRKVKRANKVRLARIVKDALRITVDPDSLFDIQVKRIHAYKRQLLNVMHIIDEYLSLVEDGRNPLCRGLYFRRKSRARLLVRQADYQVDPQRRAGD
jgi:glucan phosphorylase